MTAPLTPEELAEGLRLAEAATPGPWEVDEQCGIPATRGVWAPNAPGAPFEGDHVFLGNGNRIDPPDAAFIAAARDLLPRALDEVQAYHEADEALEEWERRYPDQRPPHGWRLRILQPLPLTPTLHARAEAAESALASAHARIGELEAEAKEARFLLAGVTGARDANGKYGDRMKAARDILRVTCDAHIATIKDVEAERDAALESARVAGEERDLLRRALLKQAEPGDHDDGCCPLPVGCVPECPIVLLARWRP